jgi:hypothetical protein
MLADLYSFLTTAPAGGFDATRGAALTALQALIKGGSPVVSRVYPDFLAERATMPALTLQMIDSRHDYVMDPAPINIEYPRVQIDVYSNDSVERETLAGYVKTALDGYQGAMGGTTVGLVMYDNEQNEYLPDSLQYRKMLDFKVIYYS